MHNKIYTVAIIGTGARGGATYGRIMSEQPEKYKVVSLCDIDAEKLKAVGDSLGVCHEKRFGSEKEFFKVKRADILVIATQDRGHVRHCLRAFELGYDVLIEKPITDKIEECEMLLKSQKKYGNRAIVCHVLRYSPVFLKVAEIINSGRVGRLISMNWVENVGWWHHAHSYVRGNWRNTEYAAPMILAKSCHDLDLIQYFAKSRCKTISSVGSLSFFKPEFAPEGAALKCTECKYIDTCPYSAKNIYIDRPKKSPNPFGWPVSSIMLPPYTEQRVFSELDKGPYGRCVFHCDNNVVDNQVVQIMFENGISVSFSMNAFNTGHGRKITFYCSLGEIYLSSSDKIVINCFDRDEEIIDVSDIIDTGHAHSGGDIGIVNALYEMMEGKSDFKTSLEASLESHIMGIKAEESRLAGGILLNVH